MSSPDLIPVTQAPEPAPSAWALATRSDIVRDEDPFWNRQIEALLSHWRTIAVVTLAVVLATLAWLLKTVPQYAATARVQVTEQSPDYATLKDSAAAAVSDAQLVNTYVAVIQGDSLARTAVTQLHLNQDPEFAGASLPGKLENTVQAFEKHLSVRRVPDTRLVEITFTSSSPARSAQVANALANDLIEFELQQNYDSATKASGWLDKELQSLQGEVEQADQALVDYEEKNQIVNVDDRQTITTQKLSQLNQSLTQAIADRIQKQSDYQAMLDASRGGSVAMPVSDSLIPQLRQKRADTAAQLAQLEVQFGPKYPRVMQLQQEASALDAAIQAEQARALQRLWQDYRAAAEREKLLTSAVGAQTTFFNDLSQRMVQYQILKRQADSKHQLYDGLLQKQREAAVSTGITSSRVNVVDTAYVPLRPARPLWTLDLAMSLVLGLLLGGAVVIGREQWDRTIRTPEDLEWLGARPLLGVVPNFAVQKGPSAGEMDAHAIDLPILRRRSAELEGYRNIRTTLQLSAADRPVRVVAITSAMPGDGKSTCVANLASTFAQTGERVLILDADLRRPSQHIGFRIHRSPGLADVLLDGADPNVAITATAIPHLFLLPVGRRVLNPSEVLQSRAFAELVKSLHGQFDRIFIDCTPMLGLSDGLLASAVADTQVIVVRSSTTPKAAIRRILSVCRQTNMDLAGFVLNGFDPGAGRGYGYGYYEYRGAYQHYHDAMDDAMEADAEVPATRS